MLQKRGRANELRFIDDGLAQRNRQGTIYAMSQD